MQRISELSSARTRSISAENPTGAPGGGGRSATGTGAQAARDLGVGWKVSPSLAIPAGATAQLADITGPGRITHLWMTVAEEHWRSMELQLRWDGATEPAICVPLGDFFCQGWASYAPVDSAVVAVNPRGGLNSYWDMPFRERAELSLRNLSDRDAALFYQVDYELVAVAATSAYLHAAWSRSNPVGEQACHTLLDTESGPGHYVGSYLAWGVNSSGWWGEGELKFFIDDDDQWPTICGTGTEDYFGGAWNFDVPGQGYTTYSTAYLGMPQVIRPDGLYQSQQRFGMYRWHLVDPVRFQRRLRVTVQALGWRSGGRYALLHDDIAATAFWYSIDPAGAAGATPLEADELEIR